MQDNQIKIEVKPHFAGGYRLEYDGKYITLLGKDRKYEVNAYYQSDPPKYEEMVLIPVVIEIRDADPKIISADDFYITIDLGLIRQCKDVPDKPILEFLHQRMKDGKIWCCWYDGFENSIGQAMPHNTPEKIRKSKMAKLIKRGLVSGCYCGCRGDYEITNKGIDWLSSQQDS